MKRILPVCLLFTLCVATASSLAVDKGMGKIWTNSIGMEFVLIPAGTFMMGCDEELEDCFDSATASCPVTISKPFYLGKYEVTQAQWEEVMGDNPSKFKGPNHPVETVSWNDVRVFIRKLNEKEGHLRYRLPTEAEWEHAARASSITMYSFGNDAALLGDYAWYGRNVDSTQPVGQKLPNAWGLHDMHGNVWEWVQDWDSEKQYREYPYADPKGPPSGWFRVFRGGSWFGIEEKLCRSSSRGNGYPDQRRDNIGFRLALDLK